MTKDIEMARDAARWRFLIATGVQTQDGLFRLDIEGVTTAQFIALIDKQIASCAPITA